MTDKVFAGSARAKIQRPADRLVKNKKIRLSSTRMTSKKSPVGQTSTCTSKQILSKVRARTENEPNRHPWQAMTRSEDTMNNSLNPRLKPLHRHLC